MASGAENPLNPGCLRNCGVEGSPSPEYEPSQRLQHSRLRLCRIPIDKHVIFRETFGQEIEPCKKMRASHIQGPESLSNPQAYRMPHLQHHLQCITALSQLPPPWSVSSSSLQAYHHIWLVASVRRRTANITRHHAEGFLHPTPEAPNCPNLMTQRPLTPRTYSLALNPHPMPDAMMQKQRVSCYQGEGRKGAFSSVLGKDVGS